MRARPAGFADLTVLAAAAVWLAACGPPDRPALPEGLAVRADTAEVADPAVRYAARIAYPQVVGRGGAVPPAVGAINRAVADSVRAFAAAVRPFAPPPPGDTAYAVRVEGGFGRAFLGAGVVSALVSVTVYTGGTGTGPGGGNVFLLPVTYDLATGRPVALADLFAPRAPWGDTLAVAVERAVLGRLARRLGTTRAAARPRSFFAAGLEPVRRGEAAFTLGPDSLWVHVPPYQLAPLSAGAFDVGVPYGALVPFARRGGVVRRLAER